MADMKFLSKAGLEKFWELIKGKFAADMSFVAGTDNVTIGLKDANGNKIGTDVVLTGATTEKAGIMTADQATKLAQLDQALVDAAPFQGLQIGGTTVELKNKLANVGLALEKVSGKESIVLKDLNGTALSYIDVSQFVIDGLLESSDVTVSDGKPMLKLDFKLADGTTKSEIIDLSGLVDVYTAGNGVNIADNVVSVKTTGDYLSATTDGLAVTDALWTEVARLDTVVANAAATDATTKADAAQAAAIAAAASDATTKADAAQAAAIAAAASDATTKADAAQAAAIAAAGTDATTKADKALTDAKAYTDAEVSKLTNAETGLLAGTLQSAKDYTDEKFAAVNDTIGTVTEGKTVVEMIEAAQTAAGKVGTDAADQALTDAKSYTDTEIAAAVNALDYTDDAVENQFVTSVSQTDGKISVTRSAISIDQVTGWATLTDVEIEAIVNGTTQA